MDDCIIAGGLLALGLLPSPDAGRGPAGTRAVPAARPDVQGFARAAGPGPLTFPQDFGPHPEYQTEWWYITGNLDRRRAPLATS